MVKCNKCKIEKESTDFAKNKAFKQGHEYTCKICKAEQGRLRYHRDPEASKERTRLNYLKHKEYYNKYASEYQKNKKQTDPVFRLINDVRSMVWKAVTRQSIKQRSRTELILGCNFEDFKQHMESRFTDGMTWENHGDWEIDHIIPLSSAKTEDEVLRLNHYTNIRPLWKEENRSKANKIMDDVIQMYGLKKSA